MKKLICGHGVNDYGGTVSYYVDGKSKLKSFYRAWTNMLERCYSDKYHQTRPTYIGCSVCDSWLSLTAFKEWHDMNYIESYHLDKDIIQKGNKIYCPESCRYIPQKLNSLLNDYSARRGKFPIGVCFSTASKINPYLAQVAINNKNTHIGYYQTAKAAGIAYANAKHKLIIAAAREQTDIPLRDGLINNAKHLLNQAEAYVQR